MPVTVACFPVGAMPQNSPVFVPTVLFVSMGGMAFGSWFAGALYDDFGFYAPAFTAGVLFNLANLVLVGFLVLRQRRGGRWQPAMA